MILAAAVLALLAPQGGEQRDELIGGVDYQKLDSREATFARMRELLSPTQGDWGDWYLLTPFPYAGHGKNDLATWLAPEGELRKMGAGGEGPDLAATYVGKKDVEVRWRELGDIANQRVDLHVHDDSELNDLASCYLYTTITVAAPLTIDFHCGSDDGMRMWFNGDLVVDKDVPRGLDPYAEHVYLQLDEGVNHLLVKIADGYGGWDFQIMSRKEMSQRDEALLYYYLDRDFPPSAERRHYRTLTYPLPDDLILEVGGLDFFADGTPLVATRRGELWRVENAYSDPPRDARFEPYATGLHETLGVGIRMDADGEAVYTVQRGELTRLLDEDGDGRADLYECFSDGWGVSGNYHEFAFGPEFDDEGNAWVTLNVGFCGGLGKSTVPYRGWALKITPQGEVIPVCDGLRSPNGIGSWTDGSMFYVDNQGDYVATNRLSLLAQGSWHGHPASLRWHDDLPGIDARPPRQPATVWFPYNKMGQSAADIALNETGGKFGPFDGQLFVGDQTRASVMRVDLQKVEGVYQGACFPFIEGLDSGVNRVAFAPDGSMLVGQTDRGWGSIGRRGYGLQRIVYTGQRPFEIQRMHVTEEGFDLVFTRNVDAESATRPDSYSMIQYTYDYHSDYGAPEKDTRAVRIAAVDLVDDRTVHLTVEGMREGYVHELGAAGVRARTRAGGPGEPLLHSEAYYTLQRIPGRRRAQDGQPKSRRILFLTHSAGFTHGVVARKADYTLSFAEEYFRENAPDGYEVLATQDCSLIEGETLDQFDAVMFYTTGELPISDSGKAALIDWVHEGGAFVGIHCATDTFYEFADYAQMIGGLFDGHPWHEDVTIDVEVADHPATKHLGAQWKLKDEIYQFRDFARNPVRVLLSLSGQSADLTKGKREDGDYAVAWWRDWGRGRVFYTALGHREEVWRDAAFMEHLIGGIEWAIDGPDLAASAPEGATLLFDGSGLDAWQKRGDGTAASWTLVPGGMEIAPGTGDIVSREHFGDALVHVEFQTPTSPSEAQGQGRGNSGVYVQGRYEVQVLDSFGLDSQLGDCGAIYGKKVPDVNACRAPERWQSYDIYFHAPRFDAGGSKTSSARMTVWHNGRLIHDDVEVDGPTTAGMSDEGPLGPLLLQDHGNRVRYRNVWVLPLEPH